MTAPAYHVGQILYHRASGERAIVAHISIEEGFTRPVIYVSAGVDRDDRYAEETLGVIYSTEPVIVPSGFYPIEMPTEPGWYWWKANLQFGGSPQISEVRMLDGKLLLPSDPAFTTYYGPKIPMP